MAVSLPPPSVDTVPVRRALLSVSDKTGVILARRWPSAGSISSRPAAPPRRSARRPAGPRHLEHRLPEMMDGRVKTLHPMVHGGLLAVRDDPAHAAAMTEHGIGAIDLVVVNLYPFQQTVAKGRTARDHREYRYRRPVDGPFGRQEPWLCLDPDRSGDYADWPNSPRMTAPRR
jgi:phosphoribosylaminoimidazolecarboxamide formyltransferase/IMP cyclohydrolase